MTRLVRRPVKLPPLTGTVWLAMTVPPIGSGSAKAGKCEPPGGMIAASALLARQTASAAAIEHALLFANPCALDMIFPLHRDDLAIVGFPVALTRRDCRKCPPD